MLWGCDFLKFTGFFLVFGHIFVLKLNNGIGSIINGLRMAVLKNV